MKLSKDEHARMLYEAEMKARDYELVKLHAARTDGRTEERITVARNALDMKMPMSDISRLTGLSFDEIRKLAHS
jgi:hypothetical protein